MESLRVFNDYQEQTAGDHNALQSFARQSFDHIVLDAVTASRRFAGFAVTKTGATEVQVAPGRMYDVNSDNTGMRVCNLASTTTQSVTSYLASASKRIVTISAFGQDVDTDQEVRDFLVDVDTEKTEPQSVYLTSARKAVLSFTPGSDSTDPQPPPLPATHVAIAYVTVDTTQVLSIEMIDANTVESTEELGVRAANLEDFKARTEPRITSLASDLAALANSLKTRGNVAVITQLAQDMARVKAQLEIPDTATDYGADRFLDTSKTDVNNTQALGYDALVQEGIRFPDANADEMEIGLFSANDPNAALSGGLLLPAYEHALKLAVDSYYTDLGIAQYGFQSVDLVQRMMSRERIRYGTSFTVCTNSAWWQSGAYDSATGTFKKDGETFQVVSFEMSYGVGHEILRLEQVWTDTYTEAYWDYVVTDHAIVGAQVAQSFLIANDMWLTKVGFYLTSVAANEAVFVSICEVTNGVPDRSKVIAHTTVPGTSLVTGDWTEVAIVPTFLSSGKRYALLLTSNANHKVGMASGQAYVDGTFFYSTDGAYYQGDLTRDMMFRLYGARFNASQVTIEFEPLNLDGGIRNIDILASTVSPTSSQLVFEVQEAGSAGAWKQITRDDLTAFAGTKPLYKFRGRFIGTRDMMPGLMLTGSRVHVSRPKLAFKHITTPITLASAHTTIEVKYLLERFDDTPHDFDCRLRVGSTWETADTVTTTLVDAAAGRYERLFTFNLATATATFTIETTGSTNSAGNTFHAAERVHWAI